MDENIQNGGSLTHYGILGQKWGVRRTENQLARASKGSSDSAKGKNSKESVKKSVKSMSDAELRQKINRMQMEKQYSQLTKAETSAGKKFVTDILSNAAKQTATNYVSKYLTKGIDFAIDKAVKK